MIVERERRQNVETSMFNSPRLSTWLLVKGEGQKKENRTFRFLVWETRRMVKTTAEI